MISVRNTASSPTPSTSARRQKPAAMLAKAMMTTARSVATRLTRVIKKPWTMTLMKPAKGILYHAEGIVNAFPP
jgi:hypothetical protein